MLELNLPKFDVKLKNINNITLIWDCIRKKYITLSPEEWVRQHFVNYLINYKGYPTNLITNEFEIKLNNQKKRCDTVIYNNRLEPLCIVEYKAPQIKISQKTFDQIIRYNFVFKVEYLIVSNGINHYCCQIDYINNRSNFIKEIPSYPFLSDEKERLKK